MSDISDISQLSLLVPWELPINRELSDMDNIKLTKILTELLKVLGDIDNSQSIVTLEQMISELETYEVFTPADTSTHTSLKYWEVEDFDSYFNVRHVQSNEPEFCLIQALIMTCHQFLSLHQLDNALIDITQIELQRQGFIAYIQLLARICNLSLPYA